MKRLKIKRDEDAQDPRVDHDNADIMFCKHRRYDLGDKDAEDPMVEVSCVYLTSPTGTPYVLDDSDSADGTNLIYDDVLEMLLEHVRELEELIETSDPATGDDDLADLDRANQGYAELCIAKWNTEHRERPGIALCRPLYLYDHSGITISAGAFSCPWDSGQVGWQYITDTALQDEWKGDREKALSYMNATLKEYDDYITGNVYGYIVERGTLGTTNFDDGTSETTVRWEHEDSCWGFHGDWWKAGDPTGMGDSFDGELKELFDSMSWSDTDTWHYTDDVPEELQ